MSEIKFKVWNGEKMLGVFDLSQNPIYWIGLEDGIRLLYTGLKDKNGKEIYEGDILSDENLLNIKGEVYFENGIFKCIDEYSLFKDFEYYDLEVIGNIYENTELLK